MRGMRGGRGRKRTSGVGQGLKYTSKSSTRYEILHPLSVVGLSTLDLLTAATQTNHKERYMQNPDCMLLDSAEFQQVCSIAPMVTPYTLLAQNLRPLKLRKTKILQ